MEALFRHVPRGLAAHFVTDHLPFRWSSLWCLVGLHNPTYTFDHERGIAEYRCFWCGRLT